MASSRGILNIQSLNELTSEKVVSASDLSSRRARYLPQHSWPRCDQASTALALRHRVASRIRRGRFTARSASSSPITPTILSTRQPPCVTSSSELVARCLTVE